MSRPQNDIDRLSPGLLLILWCLDLKTTLTVSVRASYWSSDVSASKRRWPSQSGPLTDPLMSRPQNDVDRLSPDLLLILWCLGLKTTSTVSVRASYWSSDVSASKRCWPSQSGPLTDPLMSRPQNDVDHLSPGLFDPLMSRPQNDVDRLSPGLLLILWCLGLKTMLTISVRASYWSSDVSASKRCWPSQSGPLTDPLMSRPQNDVDRLSPGLLLILWCLGLKTMLTVSVRASYWSSDVSASKRCWPSQSGPLTEAYSTMWSTQWSHQLVHLVSFHEQSTGTL